MVTETRLSSRRKMRHARDPSVDAANGKNRRSCRIQFQVDGKGICVRVKLESSVKIAVKVSVNQDTETNGSIPIDHQTSSASTPSLFEGVERSASTEETVLEKDGADRWYPPIFQVITYGEDGTPVDGWAEPIDGETFSRLIAQTAIYPVEKAPTISTPGSAYSVLIVNGEVVGAAPFALQSETD